MTLIRVDGEITRELAAAFPHLVARTHPPQTTLTGDVLDQRELEGILHFLGMLQIPVIEVFTMPDA